jgi:predicted transcriptional regulator
MNVKQILGQLGLSGRKADVYLAALELGAASVLDISRKSCIKRTTVHEILLDLQKDGLVSSITDGKKRKFIGEDPEKIKKDLEKRGVALSKILPILKSMYVAKGAYIIKKSLGIQFENAVRLLTQYMPVSDDSSRKPILFHSIRVGVYLYRNNYSDDIIISGLLHDALEFSEITDDMIMNNFGEEILNLVKASTKDDSIKDKNEKTEELIRRCVENGQDALIVKTADIIDSCKFYSAENNEDQLEYCMRNANAILKYKPDEFNDKIFEELKKMAKSSS